MKKAAALFIILAVMVTNSHAHQPRIAFGSRHPRENPIVVKKPEISQAYYGELQGEPDYYLIESGKPFVLYLNILAPAQVGARTDTAFEVTSGDRKIATLGGDPVKWKRFYEKYADDRYFRGPVFEERVEPGRYLIKVYNRGNRGKYCLAVGKIESFPLDETIKTVFTLPIIKKGFFNKPAYSAFLNLVGLFLAIELVIAAVVIAVIAVLIRALAGFRKKKEPR